MARVLFVVAVALFAAAVLAEFIYTDDQIDEINDRMATCVRNVPAKGDFNRPGDTCRFEGITALSEGAQKEALTKVVASCLTRHKVAARIVHTVRDCLAKALAKDLVSA